MATTSPGSTVQHIQHEMFVKALRDAMRKDNKGAGNVKFNFDDVQPPGVEYLTRDSYLQVNVFPTNSGHTVTVAYKVLVPDGRVTTGQFVITGMSTRTINQYTFALTEGFLQSLTVSIGPAPGIFRGDTFVQVGLQFGPSVATPMYRLLISGYPTTTAVIAWPEGNCIGSLDGTGLLADAQQTNPIAGADWTYTVPAGCRLWIHGFSATLTSSSTAANRQPQFQLYDAASNLIWQFGCLAAQAASLTQVYNVGECVTLAQDLNKNTVIPFPTDLFVYSGYKISSNTVNIQATDQWSGIWVQFDTWVQY